MVDRNIVNKLGLSKDELEKQVSEMFSEKDGEFLEEALRTKVDSRLPGTILKGTIVSQIGNDVVVEVGLKSEGIVEAHEFDESEEITPGRQIEVLLEDTDSTGGLILLSKRKADRIRAWENIIATKKEGDKVTGKVIRRIKGGLLIDISVPVFLPASQVDIRRPGDISRFIGQEVECQILKIDVEGRNIVVSRRKLIEDERRSSKEKILSEIEVGQLRKGVVKNIADFGVFVDLGGLDGLLHISDLSWGRISHPSEMLELEQEIECIVIGVDKEREKISLGLKQKTSSPWEDIEERYPMNARVKGTVVNIMNYGVFIRIEEGVEGLAHISEMSWTKRLAHPSEMLNLGDEVEAVVLSVNKERHEISLGLKQTEINPWTVASQKYPAGTIVTTKVKSLTNFGAFVEIEPGITGMIHISDFSWTKKFNHPSELLRKGQESKCVVLEVNEERQRVSLGIKQMTEDPWIRAIPDKYIPGQIIKGTVSKIASFGVFVELEPDLEGLLHISEIADHKIEKPQDVVKLGDQIEVKILRVDTDYRKIGLSLRRAQWAAEEEAEEKTRRRRPIGVQTVLSDSDLDKEKEPEEGPAGEVSKTGAQPTTEAPETVAQAGEAVEKEPREPAVETEAKSAEPSEAVESGEVADGKAMSIEEPQEQQQAPDAEPEPAAESGEGSKAVEAEEPEKSEKPAESESAQTEQPVGSEQVDEAVESGDTEQVEASAQCEQDVSTEQVEEAPDNSDEAGGGMAEEAADAASAQELSEQADEGKHRGKRADKAGSTDEAEVTEDNGEVDTDN